jgi:small ligand-binding sensory domain FIST
MTMRPAKSGPLFAAGLSTAARTSDAAVQAFEQAAQGLRDAGIETGGNAVGGADLVQFFFTAHHRAGIEELETVARKILGPQCLIGVSAESVVGGAIEVEKSPGISVLAARLPGVTISPFTTDGLIPTDDSADGLANLAEVAGFGSDTRATFFYADPFSVPMVKFLPAMNAARAGLFDASERRGGAAFTSNVLMGGMASAGRQPGENILVLNDTVLRAGGVGVTLSGPIVVDAVVSQGCRPFGPAVVITKAKGNVIFELGGRPTPDVMREAIEDLGERAQSVLKDGLLVGRVINEYKERFGRNDFLIRNVVGLDGNTGGIAVADFVKVGQTMRFHVRDRLTADEDLAMLMDVQKLYDRPAGCLIISCNSRGAKLFGHPNHDASTIARAFAPRIGGEAQAKIGAMIDPAVGAATSSVPTAGFFAAGELGPVGSSGGDSFVHAHTACVALFREAMPVAS